MPHAPVAHYEIVEKLGEGGILPWIVGFDWYRDSHHVVYTRHADTADGSASLEMRLADLRSGEEVLLLEGPIAEVVAAPDGRRISYVHSASHFDMQLHVLELAAPAADELPRAVGEPRQITDGRGLWHVHNGGWSPDGESLVYSRDTDSGDIYVIESFQ